MTVSGPAVEKDSLDVEVVYALARQQKVITLRLPVDASVSDAIKAADLGRYFEDLESSVAGVGIWGREVGPESRLKNGDRVELYRALPANPREMRRQRLATDTTMGKT